MDMLKILNAVIVAIASFFGFELKKDAEFFDEETEGHKQRMARFGDFVRKEKDIKQNKQSMEAENLDDVFDLE